MMQIRTQEGTSKLQPKTTIHELPSLLNHGRTTIAVRRDETGEVVASKFHKT